MRKALVLLVTMFLFIACGDDGEKTPVDNQTIPDETTTDETVNDSAVIDDAVIDNELSDETVVDEQIVVDTELPDEMIDDMLPDEAEQPDDTYEGIATDETMVPDEEPVPTVCKYTGKYSGGDECVEYLGPWTEEEKNTKCTAISTSGDPAALVTGPCPTEGADGYCTVDEGGGKSTNTYMYKVSAMNQTACQTFAKGVWTDL